MGKISALKSRRIYLDTNVLVYAAEYETDRVPKDLQIAIQQAHKIFSLIEKNELIGITSELTLAEVLVGALKNNRQRLAAYYRHFLSDDGPLEMISVSREIWDLSAQLRASFLAKDEKLMMPDAVQLAAAIHSQSDDFICNDKSLCNKASETGLINGWYLGSKTK